MTYYFSNGKLLLTGEYLVLDGAKALALPTKFGQSLEVIPNNDNKIDWKSIDHKGNTWFENSFGLTDENSNIKPDSISSRLHAIFKVINELNPFILKQGYSFKSTLEFSQDWGLGSSSTLINNLASWAKIDAFELLDKSFGGSGYDIACAQNNLPITYQLTNGKRQINQVFFKPSFSDCLYFVHLNKKQDSRDGITSYNSKKGDISKEIKDISKITDDLLICNSLEEFDQLINKHEFIISKIIAQKTVKSCLFSDFDGSIKSLGAWGGDFVLATSKENPIAYFQDKGYNTILSYKQMIK